MGKNKLITNMVAEIEADAYQRGFNDGLRAAAKAVKALYSEPPQKASEPNDQHTAEPTLVQALTTPHLRENSDQMRVLKAIRANPGMRGVEILNHLIAEGTPVHERTLRTALARLKQKFIEQREERWYAIEPTDQGE